jgi:hypothetical protein
MNAMVNPCLPALIVRPLIRVLYNRIDAGFVSRASHPQDYPSGGRQTPPDPLVAFSREFVAKHVVHCVRRQRGKHPLD